ncbi:MAG: hypothetical protein II896_06455 [Clostridia bacterium]|nr:hypothetical protein [Clostridia bacterium]
MNERIYMKEFQLWNGERFITFDLLEITDKAIVVAVTKEGKISVCEYELFEDEHGLYFEYGLHYTRININDFEDVE